MNKIIYILLILVVFSCKSNSIAQEKQKKTITNESKAIKPQFGDPIDNKLNTIDKVTYNSISPSTVHLTGVIIATYKDKTICGKSYKEATAVKVKSVIGSGSGIVNRISADQEIVFGFLKSQFNQFETLQRKFSKDQVVSFVVREGLCADMNETVYEIMRFSFK